MSNPVKKERLEVPIWHKPYLTSSVLVSGVCSNAWNGVKSWRSYWTQMV